MDFNFITRGITKEEKSCLKKLYEICKIKFEMEEIVLLDYYENKTCIVKYIDGTWGVFYPNDDLNNPKCYEDVESACIDLLKNLFSDYEVDFVNKFIDNIKSNKSLTFKKDY